MERQKTTIQLSRPILAHGETVETLEMQEPIGRDLMATSGHDKSEFNQRLIASCCGVPPSSIFEMAGRDVIKLQVAMNGFLVEPTTSAPSSTDTSSADTSGATSVTPSV